MKLSEIYERAAINIAGAGPVNSDPMCIVVERIGGHRARRPFADLFRPDNCWRMAWAWEWADDELTDEELVWDCRVLALCFAAAIARSEGK